MLRTALRPKSLAVLAVCLGIAAAFVLLSIWQLESSRSAQTVYDPGKEIVRPLSESMQPGTGTTADDVDTAVAATGTYLPGSTVLIENRLQDDRRGWWVVAGLQVDGTQQDWEDADADLVIPVVRGWTEDPEQVPETPGEEVSVAGRLLPQEAPVSTQDRDPRTYGSLSPAQLTNVWDVPVYSGFVTAMAEAPGDDAAALAEDDGTLPDEGRLLSPELEAVSVDQQPTDTSLDPLNVFYAIEWVVFAGFALWIWYSSVRDEHRRLQDPAAWFELEGESLPYAWDDEAQRFYYYDPVAGEYYYFDDPPAEAPDTSTPGSEPPTAQASAAQSSARSAAEAPGGGQQNDSGRSGPRSGEHG